MHLLKVLRVSYNNKTKKKTPKNKNDSYSFDASFLSFKYLVKQKQRRNQWRNNKY